MAKVRLTKPGMNTFSAMFGTVKFENGVSVEDVSPSEIRILGACTSIEVIEDDGSARQGGAAAEQVAARHTPAPNANVLERSHPNPEPAPAEITPKPVVMAEGDVGTGEPKVAEDADLKALEGALEAAEKTEAAPVEENAGKIPHGKVWTREELAAVADEHGIKGLREIADPMEVKNNSIAGLIDEIIRHQSTHKL